jgi:hypothetical protein
MLACAPGDFRVLGRCSPARATRRGARPRPTPSFRCLRTRAIAAESFAPDATGQRLWLIHELLFAGVAAGLWGVWLPRRVEAAATRRFLRRVCAFVILYYGLWASCDGLWLATSHDAAWLLRVLPNQLYYAFFVPFVCLAYSRRG